MLHQVQYCHLKQDLDHILEGAAVLPPKHKFIAESVHQMEMCEKYLTDMLELDSDHGKLARNAGAEDTWVNTTGESDDKGRS